jgi:autotransporter-associated beta strand protein
VVAPNNVQFNSGSHTLGSTTSSFSQTWGTVVVNRSVTVASSASVTLGANNALDPANRPAVSVASGGSFSTGGFSQTVAGISGAGTISTITGTLTVDNSTDNTFTGTVNGSGSLSKTNTGTLTFTSANSYSGGTNVQGGRLSATNTAGSATGSGNVNVSNATLMGNGTISPASGNSITVSSGGRVSVGNDGDTSGATLTFTPASGTSSTLSGASSGASCSGGGGGAAKVRLSGSRAVSACSTERVEE